MRLLLVIPTVFGGGAEQVAAILAREWSRGHELRVLAWQAPGESLDFGVPVQFADLGVQPGLWRKLRNVWRRLRCLREEVRGFAPDAVLAFMDEAGLPCVLAGAAGGWLDRLVVSVHHDPQWLPRWRRALLAVFYRFPGRVVAVSQGVAGSLERDLGLPRGRLRAIPNPLVLDEGQGQSSPAAFAQRGEAGGAAGCLLSVGRLDVYTKGLDLLLAAYAALPAGRPPLVLLGEGSGRAFLEAEILRLGLQGEVSLPGWVRDPRPFYRQASLLVLASRHEGWSNVLMEAMAEGCPVLAADCPHGPSEVLGTELAAWLVPPGDARALSLGLRRALALSETERAALSGAVRARARQFAVERVAPQWLALVDELAVARQAEKVDKPEKAA